MKNKTNLLFFGAIIGISLILILGITLIFGVSKDYTTDSVTVKNVSSQVLADGAIASQNEATLHFQTGGQLVYLATKEGGTVYQGATIARLDTYALQKQVLIAANAYQTTKNGADQTNENTTAGVVEGQQRVSLDSTNKTGYSNITQAQVITDQVKRIVDNSALAQNSAQLNVDLANYALSLASLNAPFNGLIVHEDVNTTGVNVTPVTSFLIIDPNALVFRAQVNEQDIDYVDVGSSATVNLNGGTKEYTGSVTKIYPEKVILATGQKVYEVDISVNDTKGVRYAQAGSVKIQSNTSNDTKLVPRWTVLNGQQIWVEVQNNPVLRTVTTGKTHGDYIEITSGLLSSDKIIVSPQTIIKNKYKII